jgi:glycosyltransferase involved in cell wall biosynthesis
MNILFLTSSLPRFKGDSQAPFVLEQAIAWKQAQPKDKVIILAPDDSILPKKEETVQGVLIKRYSYFWPRNFQRLVYRPTIYLNIMRNKLFAIFIPFLLFWQTIAGIRLVRKENINLIYAHWFIPQGLVAFFIYLFCRQKYVVHNHSSDLRIIRRVPFIGPSIAGLIVKNAATIFCVNSKLQEELLTLFSNKDKDEVIEKTYILPMGVKDWIVQNPSKNNNKYTFGFLGRFVKKKGLKYFLKALDKPELKKGESLKVAIAGGIGNKKDGTISIKYLGFLSGDEKYSFIQNSRCMVFPYIQAGSDIEGLPVALLESLIYGNRVIASKATNIELLPEWSKIKSSVTLLDNPNNTREFKRIIRLEINKKRRLGVYKSRRTIMSRYKWNHLIQEYLKLLKKE